MGALGANHASKVHVPVVTSVVLVLACKDSEPSTDCDAARDGQGTFTVTVARSSNEELHLTDEEAELLYSDILLVIYQDGEVTRGETQLGLPVTFDVQTGWTSASASVWEIIRSFQGDSGTTSTLAKCEGTSSTVCVPDSGDAGVLMTMGVCSLDTPD